MYGYRMGNKIVGLREFIKQRQSIHQNFWAVVRGNRATNP